MRTYYLKTPHFKAPAVAELQRALLGSSFAPRSPQDFSPGAVDGEFGPRTAAACKRAKFWLGYSKPTGSGGQLLYEYLTKRRPLTRAMLDRREARLAEHEQKYTLAERILQVAQSQVGAPGSVEQPKDVNKYTRWWFGGRAYPIGNCSIFASWCCAVAGSTEFHPCTMSSDGRVLAEGFSDYSEEILAAARARSRGLRVIGSPVPGCLVVFDWDGGATDHTAVFVRLQGGQVTTIDANCPDRVAERTRHRSTVVAYILPTK